MTFLVASGPALSLSPPGSLGFDSWTELDRLNDGKIAAAFRYLSDGQFRTAVSVLDDEGAEFVRQRDADDGSDGQRDFSRVSALENGGFAVTWSELDGDFKLHSRTFDSRGRPASEEREVFNDITFDGTRFDTAPLANGGYVVVGADNSGWSLRRFREDGTSIGETTPLPGLSSRLDVIVSTLGDGRLAVFDGNSAQILDRRGRPEGEVFDLSVGGFFQNRLTVLPLSADRNLLVGSTNSGVTSVLTDGDLIAVGAATFLSDGGGSDVRHDVALLSDGTIAVAWIDRSSPGELTHIEARLLDSNGVPQGDVQRLTVSDREPVLEVNIAEMDNGSLAVGYGVSFVGRAGSEARLQVFASEASVDQLGRNRAEALDGTRQGDVIAGQGGHDTIMGADGNDALHGQRGNDRLSGNNGRDWIDGGAGADRAWGGAGNDTVMGGAGRDRLNGDTGRDLLIGGEGADILKGNNGADTLEGGLGDDDLQGGRGADLLIGGGGNDQVVGGGGQDTLIGGDGLDTLTGGAGADRFILVDEDSDSVITDFDLTQDRLDLSDWIFGSSPSGESFVDQFGSVADGSATLGINGNTVLLEGVTDLDALAPLLDL